MTFKSINSRDNALYKEIRLLASNTQARRKAGRSVLDGIHLCQSYLDQVGLPALCIFSVSAQTHPEVASIVGRCAEGAVQCLQLADNLFSQLSQVEQGISLLFVIQTPAVKPLARITEAAVLLDNLQDPGNVGSILRSAAAAGIKQVFSGPGTAFAWSSKVLRAGMGAHFALDIHENVDLEGLVRDAGVTVIATSSHVPKTLYDLDLSQDVAWLFGHEGRGVSDVLMSLAGERVTIPHLGPMESLNVAASAAICFFEQVRQRVGNAASK